MPRARRAVLVLTISRALTISAALTTSGALFACGSPELDPYCADYDDVTGRPVALCRDLHETPVCDEPGDAARFERTGGTVVLIGGRLARCDDEQEIFCEEPTSTAYCLPELID